VSEENHVFAFYKMILTKYKSVRRRIRVFEKLSLDYKTDFIYAEPPFLPRNSRVQRETGK
jgi:hypothetical protein